MVKTIMNLIIVMGLAFKRNQNNVPLTFALGVVHENLTPNINNNAHDNQFK